MWRYEVRVWFIIDLLLIGCLKEFNVSLFYSKILELGGQDEFYFLMIMLHFNQYIKTLASNGKVTLHMKIMPDFYENRYPT